MLSENSEQRVRWLTRDGEPVDGALGTEAWAQVTEWEKERRVGITTVGEHSVSTVYLALNHEYGDGPPLIFETMIFPDETLAGRYATEEEAMRGHLRVVDSLRAQEEARR